mmetsp:Transcript_45349/g.119825  ORF Transcript_45349/g.119825 Transcript_45349/m.119825 type:complete len:101 (+) Transcript_45349:100-402(+)
MQACCSRCCLRCKLSVLRSWFSVAGSTAELAALSAAASDRAAPQTGTAALAEVPPESRALYSQDKIVCHTMFTALTKIALCCAGMSEKFTTCIGNQNIME